MNIPYDLLRGVETGNVVLVLGAGASIGAQNENGGSPPTGAQLAQMLAARFLGGEHSDAPLPVVAELAISESDLTTVQEHIRHLFEGFQPASFHQLLPTFKWAALATTNFDLIVERAYDKCAAPSQELVPFLKNGDRVDDKLRSNASLMLLKLHGCITLSSNSDVPLILSTDQYVSHRHGRERLFDHLRGLAFEHPLVFVGQSLQDPDIRHMLLELGSSDTRPRFYTVTPDVTDPERRFWESKRITPLSATFEEFLTTLDHNITSALRGVMPTATTSDLPISERFVVRQPSLSPSCLEFLNNDVDYVKTGMPTEGLQDSRLFYRGHNPRWAAVAQDLDVRRDVQDTILSDAILGDDEEQACQLFVVKGHAGSGKTVLLQRIAWESALQYGRLCLFLRAGGQFSFDVLRELSRVVDERIYLFIDDIDEHVNRTLQLLQMAKRSQFQLTIIGAARINEWNMTCEELEPYVTDEFQVRYLSHREIDQLLDLLEEHRALFQLEKSSLEQRRAAFTDKAGRQLLVALHEATLGKPFEDIIADEFAEIRPEAARVMYLGICFLNRYGVAVRAGIIARLYGIRFTDFRESFFPPLEGLVFARFDSRTRDYVYETRHQHIAEIVVERILSKANDRLDMLLQMINSINIDYRTDRFAYRKLVRGKSLLDELSDHQMVEAVYSVAKRAVGEDPYLLHQMAIYEFNRPNGNLNKAAETLATAQALAPNDKTILHSRAELLLRRAEYSQTYLEFEKYVSEARKLAATLVDSGASDSHGIHTLAKTYLAKLERLQSANTANFDIEFSEVVKDAEQVLEQGLQQFPGDPYLLQSESELGELLADSERSERALHIAFQKNPYNPFIAVRLAKLYVRTGQTDKALEVYTEALNSGIAEKRVHYNYARLLMEQTVKDEDQIEHHLRRGFTDGDANIEAQFWYARQLYLNGRISESQARFKDLKNRLGDPKAKRLLRGPISASGSFATFTGRVDHLEADYGFIVNDGISNSIFVHRNNVQDGVWDLLSRNTRVRFAIAFNFLGPGAFEVALE